MAYLSKLVFSKLSDNSRAHLTHKPQNTNYAPKDYTYIDTKTGTNSITIPNGAKEVFYIVYFTGATSMRWSGYLVIAALSTTTTYYRHGYYPDTLANNGSATIAATTTSIKVHAGTYGGSSNTNMTLVAYYR